MRSNSSGAMKCAWISITFMRRFATDTSRRRTGEFCSAAFIGLRPARNTPAAADTPALRKSLRLGLAGIIPPTPRVGQLRQIPFSNRTGAGQGKLGDLDLSHEDHAGVPLSVRDEL